ncbi:MAG: valine--tRNA ligase [Candidatus Omnitrophica bacterium]|nr:valine--tRNA ligase [Candidatus Omnitrophota bacterium]
MEISSRYNHKEIEPKILKKWLESTLFKATKSKQPAYSIVIPPPNVTGILHMGHALNNTIQDILIRYKRMQGYQALWMPGTDHAGIATQNVVEKKLAKQGLKKEDIGREEFLKQLWAWRDQYGSTIIDQLKKLGSSCDWSRTRFTMDEGYSKAVTRVFVELWKKKLIYQGDYIINWCPRCKTALSDEEAPHQQREGSLYYIKYPIKGSDDFVVVATTRPETMLGDTAVAINPKDKRYKSILGQTIILPLTGREIKVISDEFVDPGFGTGAVKVTPAHDPNDFEIGQRHKLPSVLVMSPDGSMNENAAGYQGMDRFEAREAILQELTKQKLLEKTEPHSYSVGQCYRCDTLVEPYLSRQWFVKMKPLAKPAIKAVKNGEIKFHPSRWTKVYLNWMENIRDWCISRQIWWGHRIPIYYCRDCQKEVIAAEVKPKKCRQCGSTNLWQDENVLDTWFSSWLWPFATFGWPEKSSKKELDYFYPTDVLVTAPEIIFFWVARMIMAGFEFTGKKPFSDVFIHGTVRDKTGKKMSKSLGNTIDPLGVIDNFGADALRFSITLCAASGSDVYLSDEKFLVGRNFCNKIWNSVRFIFLKIEQANFKIDDLENVEKAAVDKWILDKLSEAIDEISASLDKYRLNDAAKKIYDFFWHDFCDWYIEIIKDDFNLTRAKVSLKVLLSAMKLLHPIMPFITEEVFSLIKQNTNLSLDESIVVSSWSKPDKKISQKEIIEIQTLVATIKEIRNIKAILGITTKKTVLEARASDNRLSFLKENQAWLKRLTFSESIEFKNAAGAEKLSRVLYDSGLWEINLAVKDIEKSNFVAALSKKIESKTVVLTKIQKRLASEQFRKNAPLDKVQEAETAVTDLLTEVNRIKDLKNAFN